MFHVMVVMHNGEILWLSWASQPLCYYHLVHERPGNSSGFAGHLGSWSWAHVWDGVASAIDLRELEHKSKNEGSLIALSEVRQVQLVSIPNYVPPGSNKVD